MMRGRDVEDEMDDATKSRILGLEPDELEPDEIPSNIDAPPVPRSRSGSIDKIQRRQSLMGQGKLQN